MLKKKFDSATRRHASARPPGPTSASAAVKATHPSVVATRSRFLAARWSAYAPITGPVIMTAA